MHTNPAFIAAATSSSSNDSWAITWHQWQAAYPTDSRIGTSRAAASASASGVHCCQCTGLSACWRRYGLVASTRVLPVSPAHARASSAVRRSVRRSASSGSGRVPSSAAWSGSGSSRSNDSGSRLQMPVHRPHQQERADQQQHDDQQAERAGLAEVGPGVLGRVVGQQAGEHHQRVSHRRARYLRTGRSPGRLTGTRERASSNSSWAIAVAATPWAWRRSSRWVDLGGVRE